METGQPGNPATARPVQTTSQELRTAVLSLPVYLEPQGSTTSASAVSGTSSTTFFTVSTQVSAMVTPVTTFEATVGSKQLLFTVATVNSVEVVSFYSAFGSSCLVVCYFSSVLGRLVVF